MNRELRIARELALPLEAVTKKFGFFGQNGTGKTYAAMKLAELMLDADAQIVVIDPVGKWYGLRLAGNGRDPSGIEIPVFGGLHGDIPLQSTAGELIADVIVDRGISAVLDVSQFEYDTERARFVEHFARRLFHRKKAAPSAIHIFVEEAQEFLPIAPQRGEEKMLHEVLRIGKIGRNHGFGWTLITPRPQEITTKARNLSEVVLAFQLNGTHERKAIAEWVKEKGQDLDVVDLLPKLKQGTAHAWSPSWLEYSGTVHIEKKRTLGSIDLEQLRTSMAATIEKAKAEDPKELQREIARLKSELLKAGKATPAPDPAAVQRAVDAAVAAALTNEWKTLREALKFIDSAAGGLDQLERLAGVIGEQLRGARAFLHKDVPPAPAKSAPVAAPRPIASRTANTNTAGASILARVERPGVARNGELSAGEQRVLNALRELQAMGVQTPTRAQAGAMARYDLTGGSGSTYVSRLVANGYINLPGTKGTLQLTEFGAAAAAAPPAMLTDEDLQRRAVEYLKPGEARILKRLIELYPETTTRAQLGPEVGYDLTGGSGSTYVGKLVRLGFAELPGTGQVRASVLLFPSRRG